MRPEFLGHFLRAFYLSERPGAVTELLRGLREALAPEKSPSYPAGLPSNSIAGPDLLPGTKHQVRQEDSGRTKRLSI